MECSETTNERTLQPLLDAYCEEWVCSVPPERVQVYEEFIAGLRDSGITEGALNVGDEAPVFELPNAAGDLVSLSKLLEHGPVVLTWYRGNW